MFGRLFAEFFSREFTAFFRHFPTDFGGQF